MGLFLGLVTEGALETTLEPLRKITADIERCVGDIALQPAALGIGQGFGRMWVTLHHGVDFLDEEAPDAGDGAESECAGAVILHRVADRGLVTQGVEDQAGDPGAVAGTGIAIGLAPVAHGVLDRRVLTQLAVEDFNRRGDLGCISHFGCAPP